MTFVFSYILSSSYNKKKKSVSSMILILNYTGIFLYLENITIYLFKCIKKSEHYLLYFKYA